MCSLNTTFIQTFIAHYYCLEVLYAKFSPVIYHYFSHLHSACEFTKCCTCTSAEEWFAV